MLRLDLSNAMLGINNRNLEDFTVDLGNTRAIMQSPAGQEVAPWHLLLVFIGLGRGVRV